jgi:hypothetical protein
LQVEQSRLLAHHDISRRRRVQVALGPKRTSTGRQDRLHRSRMTQLRHARRCSEIGGASVHDDLSQDSVRFGQPGFAFTYSSAAPSIIGRTLSLIGWIKGTVVFHFVPSHWTREIPP